MSKSIHLDVTVRCPHCGVELATRVWSLSGSGKRCKCGATFHRNNATGDLVAVHEAGR